MGKIIGLIIVVVIIVALISPNGADLLANFFMTTLAVVAGTGLFIILKATFDKKE